MINSFGSATVIECRLQRRQESLCFERPHENWLNKSQVFETLVTNSSKWAKTSWYDAFRRTTWKYSSVRWFLGMIYLLYYVCFLDNTLVMKVSKVLVQLFGWTPARPAFCLGRRARRAWRVGGAGRAGEAGRAGGAGGTGGAGRAGPASGVGGETPHVIGPGLAPENSGFAC